MVASTHHWVTQGDDGEVTRKQGSNWSTKVLGALVGWRSCVKLRLPEGLVVRDSRFRMVLERHAQLFQIVFLLNHALNLVTPVVDLFDV